MATRTLEQSTGQAVEAIQWAQLFHEYSVAVIVPVVLAYLTYKGIKAKVDAENRRRRARADYEDIGDETMMNWIKKKVKDDS